MAFNPDDKIQWENFSPTLQALLDNKIKAGGQDYFNNNINKYVDQAVNTSKNYTNTQINSPTFMQKILVNVMSTEPTGEFKKYMDNAIFTNLPPKVGYLDDTKMQIYSAFNMSYNTVYNRAPWICSDSEGRTNVWFEASSNTSEPLKIFRGFRVFESAEFSFENDPIIPEFLVTRNAKGEITSTNGYIAHIMAMECGYMIVQLNNGQYHFIDTKFSGNPRNWTDHRDVTAAFNHASSNYGAYLGCLYSKKYNKLLLVNTSNNVIRMSIYNSSNNLTRNGIWFEWTVQGSGVTQNYKNIPGYSAGGYLYAPGHYSAGNSDMLVFNKDDSLLHLVLSFYGGFYRNTGTSLKFGGNLEAIYVIVSKVDENTLFNGSSTPTQQMPTSVYDNVRGNNPNNFPGGMKVGTWGTKTMLYDTLLKRYVIVRHPRDCAESWIYFTKKDSIKADLWQRGTEMFGIIATERFMPPDACPWAKKMYVPQVRYESLYLRGCSKTFGDYRYIGFKKTYSAAKGFSVQAGSWKINPTKTCGFNDKNVCCAMNGPNYADWWFCGFNGRTQIQIRRLKTTNRTTSTGLTIQDELDVDGALTTYDITWMASLLNGYALYRVAYHPATDTIYIFAHWKAIRVSAVDATNSNRGLWLFMVNRSSNTLIGKWRMFGTSKFAFEDRRLNSNENSILQPLFISNIFIISRDEFVVKGYFYGTVCEECYQTSWFKPSGQSGQDWNETAIGRGNDPNWAGGADGCIGWNQTYNYFICNSPVTFYSSGVASSKNATLGSTVYTKDEFYTGGKGYQETYGLAGSIGLVCTIPATPIFLGGYYSIIPATEVSLYDNATNYIYLHRDPDDRTNVFIECYTEPISKLPKTSTGDTYSDSSQFARVIVAEIETSAGYPIKQTIYPVGDGYLK